MNTSLQKINGDFHTDKNIHNVFFFSGIIIGAVGSSAVVLIFTIILAVYCYRLVLLTLVNEDNFVVNIIEQC